MDREAMERRTKEFALRVFKVVNSLPKTVTGHALGAQLVRSATSIGANYRAASRSRFRTEFIARLGVVLEEADESVYWLELIMDGELLPKKRVALLHNEARELTAIIAAARRSTLTNRKS